MPESNNFNYLRDEKSKYLTQHSKNPVNWYPYGPEALQKSTNENKPIFLSIGYSSSHWCHIMAEESFCDDEIADILNKEFICVKVDKEELPDLDSYYQLACQVMNGKGGWPLNAFLTPEMKPFFIGTYFPKTPQEGIPSFKELIVNLSKAYKEDFENVSKNSNQISETLLQPPKVENKVQFDGHYPNANSVLNALKNYQDDEFGGYGVEPKFPHYAFLEWAIEHMLEGIVTEEFGNHIIKTIENMLMGGIYDHSRGGVHRYVISKDWKIPHFEKLLSDQAGLIKLLSKATLVYPSPLLYDALIQTIDFLATEMISDQGTFFTSQDSDSEGVQGLYYTFTKDEFIDSVVQFDETLSDKMEDILKWFDIKDEGHMSNQLNIIALNESFKNEFYTPEGWDIVRKVRQSLTEARKLRFPPGTDTKSVASWNFQVLTSLLDVIQYCRIDAISNAARDLFGKTHENIQKAFFYQDEEGKARIKTTTTREGHVPLFEDYVFFAELSFRAYELFGSENFYINGKSTIDFIKSNFFKDNIIFTRAIAFSDTEGYDNIHTPIFDQSYKSPLSTLITMLRKWSLIEADFKDFLEELNNTIDSLTHLSLQNPLAFGETLRALVYPDEAFRKIEVPLKWLKNRSFHPFFGNFSVRFALKYHREENEKWQIWNNKECELQGDGIEDFKKAFAMPVEEA